MSWLKNVFGGGAKSPESTAATADPGDAAFAETAASRDRYWAQVGTSESDVLTYLISPQLMGGSAWPTTRQAYRVVHTEDSIILATDGLGDPFDDEAGEGAANGFEMELYVETRDVAAGVAGAPGEVDPLKSSWAFVVLQEVAKLVASAGGVVEQLEAYGVLSVELPGIGDSPAVAGQLPKGFLVGDGTLGLLLGVPAQGRSDRIADAPLSPIRMVAITLITGAELEGVRAGGGAARRALVDALTAEAGGHFSALTRSSLV